MRELMSNNGDNGRNVQPTFTLLPDISSTDPVSGFEIPPDKGLAVNAGYIVSDVNSVVKWTDITGANPVEDSMSTFFSPLGTYSFFIDARAIYNDATGQFILSSSAPDAASNYHVLLGISNDSNPYDGFTFQSFQYTDTTALIDQPDVAADGSTLFMVASVGAEQLVLVNNNDGQGGATKQVDISGGGIYKQIASQDTGDYALAQESGTLTLKHLNTAGVVDGTSSVDLGNISSNYGEQYLPTQGETQPLDAADQRVYGLALSNGTLWTTFEVTPTSGPDAGTPNVHWAELNVSNLSDIALIDQGTISGFVIGASVGTETGSVAVDGAGDVIMSFVASGPDMTPTDYFEVKAAGESVFSAPIAWDSSAGPYFQPDAGVFGSQVASRWGDYSSAVADPNNPRGFYISNEVGITPGSWEYSSPVAHVIVPPSYTV